MKRYIGPRAVPKVYVALGFHECRLEIALLRLMECGKRHITLRSAPVPYGVVCAESGALTRPADIQTRIGQLALAIKGMGSVELLIGIPDNLCRARTLGVTKDLTAARHSSELNATPYEDARIVDIFPKRPPVNPNQESFVVSCAHSDIERYISAVIRNNWVVGLVTPLMVARYNYLMKHLSESSRERVLIVHGCETACDIALWYRDALLYRERLTRDNECTAWESACLRRVEEVAARITGEYVVMLRAQREVVSMITSGLSARKILLDRDAIEPRLADSVDGEVESLNFGCFDVTLGLLAAVARAGD